MKASVLGKADRIAEAAPGSSASGSIEIVPARLTQQDGCSRSAGSAWLRQHHCVGPLLPNCIFNRVALWRYAFLLGSRVRRPPGLAAAQAPQDHEFATSPGFRVSAEGCSPVALEKTNGLGCGSRAPPREPFGGCGRATCFHFSQNEFEFVNGNNSARNHLWPAREGPFQAPSVERSRLQAGTSKRSPHRSGATAALACATTSGGV
jgi:hypothetical protein